MKNKYMLGKSIKKVTFLFVVYILNLQCLFSSTSDSIKSNYANGEFHTFCQLAVNSNDSISNEVVNKFVYQMCYDLDGLFKWGLKGMSLSNSKDELLKFDFKTTKYDKKTSILRGIGDVIVPGITTFPDVFIDSKVVLLKYANGNRDVKLELVSENTFIKNMVGTFSFIPKNDKKTAYYKLETHIQFGWFFNIFITQTRYKKIMEWRIKQLLINMKEESEKRQKQLKL